MMVSIKTIVRVLIKMINMMTTLQTKQTLPNKLRYLKMITVSNLEAMIEEKHKVK